MRRPAALLLLAAALGAGCDVGASVDLEPPPFAPGVAVRATLAAGAPPVVRLSLGRDPYGPAPETRQASATPAGAAVTLWRDGRLVETLAPRPQTCYARRETRCDPATGTNVVTVEEGAYDCGAFGGALPVEPGAVYTVRATVPGLPPAEATVRVPAPVDVSVTETAGPDATTRRLAVTVPDAPGAGTRFGFVVFRHFDRYSGSVCAVGGPRDTTVVLGYEARAGTRFGSTDPVLLADAAAPPNGFRLVTFSDATFPGGAATVTLDVPRESSQTSLGLTGGLTVQLAVLSETLADAYRVAASLPEGETPFLEPVTLPANVAGGYGRVGAVALSEASVP